VTARIFVLAALRDASTEERPTPSFERLILAQEGVPLLLRWGCCAGYLLWFAMAAAVKVLSPGAPNFYYIFFHNGGAVPSMALVLLGSATGVDPIAKVVFQSKAFKVLARVSYSQYLLQIPVAIFLAYYLCPGDAKAQQRLPSSPQEPAFLASFPFVLLGAAYLAERFIGRPFTEWQRAREREGAPGLEDEVLAWYSSLTAALHRLTCCRGKGSSGSGSGCCGAGDEGKLGAAYESEGSTEASVSSDDCSTVCSGTDDDGLGAGGSGGQGLRNGA